MDLSGKVIAVTGAAQGIGASICQELSAAGADLALIDLNTDGLLRTQALLDTESETYPIDITDESSVEATFAQIVKKWGRLDGLVNNAGILADGLLVKRTDKSISKMSLAQFESVIKVNLIGTFLCGREAVASMLNCQSKGVIINISSVARAGNIGQSNYSASKAAVATLAVGWGKELARHGIRAAAIAPGVVKTEMIDALKDQAKERLNASIPLGRVALPIEIAKGVRFILENDYYTARVLELDGGLVF
ncbi:SDR family NAD(P)-dependent oxidoreductase [Vibrio sonorensis]|uniref:SDR family NAD(P)-dependent oxidoreductase n=1 Tax=Vibrio sonorensis TaxID=1004316 RepID=UPI0008D9EF98|nr:SDR family NAD(P)-dependent oxidoreductase [Vibrio sonorensis]